MMRRAQIEEDMLSVEDAQERVLSYFRTLEAEERPLLKALGQTLAEDVYSSIDIPPWPNSAMDGYAVRQADIGDATPSSPRVLKVIGLVAAGRLPKGELVPGTAMRIMTGAPVPKGADTVVPFEDTDELQRKVLKLTSGQIGIKKSAPVGAYLRPRGEDVPLGQMVLRRGTVLKPAHIGVLASLGLARVSVVRRPKVAVISTGDELERPGSRLHPGRIYDSNSFSVASAVSQIGGIPRPLGIAHDNLSSINNKLDRGLQSDMLITSAGVSKGDYDLVKDVLMRRGAISFWSVRMRPAKPLAFGVIDALDGRKVPHIGLPGNPVSAMVAFEVLCRPAILKMLGQGPLSRPTVEAVLQDPIINSDGRRVYARAIVTRLGDSYCAKLTGPQGSNILTSMVRANGLAICPEDVSELRAGERVKVILLDWPEDCSD